LTVQLLGHLGERVSRLAELVDPVQEPPVVGHLLVTLHRTLQLVAAEEAPGPVDDHVDPFALPADRDHHFLHQEADDPLTIRCSRARSCSRSSAATKFNSSTAGSSAARTWAATRSSRTPPAKPWHTGSAYSIIARPQR